MTLIAFCVIYSMSYIVVHHSKYRLLYLQVQVWTSSFTFRLSPFKMSSTIAIVMGQSLVVDYWLLRTDVLILGSPSFSIVLDYWYLRNVLVLGSPYFWTTNIYETSSYWDRHFSGLLISTYILVLGSPSSRITNFYGYPCIRITIVQDY